MHRIYQSRRKLAASIASAAKAEDELLQASSSSSAPAPAGTAPLSLTEETHQNERKRQIEDVMDADENDNKQNTVAESVQQVAVTSSVSSSPPHKKAAIPRSPEATSTLPSTSATALASETVLASTSSSEKVLASTSPTQMSAGTTRPTVPISSSNGNGISPPKTKSNSPLTPMAASGPAIATNGTAAVLSQDQTIPAIDLRTPPPSLPQGVVVTANSEVSIVNPPPPPPAPIPIHPEMITKDPKGNNPLDKNEEDEEYDDIQVISSTTINPNIQYPHKRIDCGVFSFSVDPSKFCDKCYCVVCDIPAKDCSNWGDHSVQKCRPAKSKSDDCMTDDEGYDVIDEILLESPTTTARNYYTRQRLLEREPQETDAAEVRRRDEERRRQRERERERPSGANDDKLRILEVLSRKLRSELRISEGGRTLTPETESSQNAKQQQQKNAMEGDIPQLGLHSSFFVEGIKIGWPFPAIMLPQRQMAIHIIKGLKRQLHVVLESPTGTGKSVAILCSVLAWQRYHMQTNGLSPRTSTGEDEEKIPQIIYCSRTHSQVAQMVASLKKTPYRPTMTVLGSRQRLCIHKELTGAKKKQNKVPLNLACTARKRNTEIYRRNALKRHEYDDDNPRTWDYGDIVHEGTSAGDAGEDGTRPRKKKPTCPHFRQLTSERTASMAVKQLMGSHRFRVNSGGGCCGSSSAVGGEESIFGVHDMEDLVRFGKNPYTEENIAVYRGKTGKFGFLVNDNSNHRGETTRGCHIVSLVKDGAAAFEARLQDGDKILKINGKDVRTWNKRGVVELLGQTPKDQPARLNVLRACSDTSQLLNPEDDFIGVEDMDHPEAIYSDHSVCPYYLSRTMQAHAELTFAPYNYILDPNIRSKMNISLENAVVVLDEAHNVESTLCEGGSGKYGEMDFFQLVPILGNFAHRTEKTGNITLINKQVEVDTAMVAHELLLFLEKIIFHLQKLRREKFENGPAREKLENDYKKYRNIPHDHEVELSYDGPTGYGIKRVAVGCQPFLTRLGIEKEKVAQLFEFAASMENELFGGNSNNEDVKPSDNGVDENPNVLTILVELLAKLVTATENPEHYYISCVVQANGNLDHAFGIDDDDDNNGSGAGYQRFKKKPRKVPFMRPRTEERPNAFLPLCQHDWCKLDDECNFVDGVRYGVRHGDYCDGSTPAWECHLVLRLLSPGLLMREIAHQCRSVILASGSLAPLPSVCAELNLFGKDSSSDSTNRYSMITGNKLPTIPQSLLDSTVRGRAKKLYSNRLQTTPKPLEANHVVNLQKQLLAVSIGNFPNGEKLTVTQKNYGNNPSFLPKFGDAVASVIEGIPKGGCLVFLPSYSFLKKCVSCWHQESYNSSTYQNSHRGRYFANNSVSRDDVHSTSIWDRFLRSKGKIIVEPTGGQEEFEAARDEYQDTIRATGSCILLAVFRGKMSEGIDFNDDNARAVICVGLPLPSWFDRSVKAKMAYNDEQRNLRKKTCLLPGRDFYHQQAYRAIAQALGRCIRHGADYGTVILMDSRHCHDGSPTAGSICRAHSNLPKWMRGSVQTLSMEREDRRVNGQQQPKMIYGGYAGLKREMRQFFAQAPKASREVRAKWKADRERAISASSSGSNVIFHRDTGNWTTVPEASSHSMVEETSQERGGVQI